VLQKAAACLPVNSNSVLVDPGLFIDAEVVKGPGCASSAAENVAVSPASVAHDAWAVAAPNMCVAGS